MNLVETIRYYQRRHRLASHLLFWILVLLVSVSSSKYYDGRSSSYSFELVTDALYLIPEILASYFLTYWVIPQFFTRKRYILASVGFLAGAYVICALGRFIIVRICEPLAGIPPEAFETNRELLTNIPKLIYRYFFQIFSMAFFFLFFRLVFQQLDHQKRTLSLEKEKIATELKLLKAQLNPHFLFNTLNNIYSLSLVHSPATASSIGKLSEILDYILYRCEGNLVPLEGEIRLLNDYLALERLRYDDRLDLRFTPSVVAGVQVPPLLLLSLAENAFKHGASQDIGRPRIEITLRADEERLEYCVVNTVATATAGGNGAAHPAVAASGNGAASGSIGLSNLRKQLEFLYPGRHSFSTGMDGAMYRANLILHLNTAPHGHPVPAR